MLDPEPSHRMTAMPPRAIVDRHKNVPATLDTLDLALENSQLGRINQVVRGIDSVERRGYLVEMRRGIVFARGLIRVEHVIGIVFARGLAVEAACEDLIGLV